MSAGLDERAVRSAKATVPFLARLTGQGLESGDIRPSIVRFKVRGGTEGPHAFDAVTVTVNDPGLVGMPEMFPVVGFRDKPWGRKLAPKLVGLWFVLGGGRDNGTPVPPDAFV